MSHPQYTAFAFTNECSVSLITSRPPFVIDLFLVCCYSPNTRPCGDIKDYPFLTTATILSWPCLPTFHDLKPSQMSIHFWDDLEHIVSQIEAWWESGEEQLVECWKSGAEPTGGLANRIVKVRLSTQTSGLLARSIVLRFAQAARRLQVCHTIFAYSFEPTLFSPIKHQELREGNVLICTTLAITKIRMIALVMDSPGS
ncbi:hypothetical protein FRC10_010408 [Ceratobasidium sp. 414]|nr:hypothetical protein FRC10_010408 [Ceratobasidium sp. 414]